VRKGRASSTAQFVAFNRALGNLAPQVTGFADPMAEKLLPANWVRKIERARARLPRSPLPFWMRGMALFNQFRTVVIDRAILAALPFEQLVILGAGFDGRAWRLPELKDTVVFEVDHPDTQAGKRESAARTPAIAREVRFVAVDFSRDDLATRLRETGFDPGKKTFWLWEGVTMYLPLADIQKTLAAIGLLSGSSSQVALTYLARSHLSLGTRAFLVAFGLMTGEPMRSYFTVPELDALGRGAGWTTLSNTGIADWKPELAPTLDLTRRQVGIQWNERVWVGRQ
jgi:methyltransferase (TIGR00027 family)